LIMKFDQTTEVDVLIAGAGPAGLAFANHLVDTGRSVILADSRKVTGKPLRCVEVTRPAFFGFLGMEPREGWIRWELDDASGKMIVLNRPVLEADMTGILSRKGIRVLTGTTVTGVDAHSGPGRSVRLSCEGREFRVFARLVVAADGVLSRVAQLAGLNTHLPAAGVLPCLSYRCDSVVLNDSHRVMVERPGQLTPGFFWMVPTGSNQVNVGMSIRGTEGHKLRASLDERIRQDPDFKNARIVEEIAGFYPFAMPFENPFSDSLLVLGTAARLVDASNGEGIVQAAESGMTAAQVFIASAFDNRAGSLSEYRRRLDPLYNHLKKIFSGCSA
jgi:digeranylgeranylglycerophospholipid reductase